MQETSDDLEALQQLLDASYEAAGPHLMSIHGDGNRLSADEFCNELNGIAILDLATVSSTNAPYVAPVDGVLFKGRFWFATAPESLRIKHIRNNPQVSAAHTRGEKLSILIHGVAREVDTNRDAPDGLHDCFRTVYGPDYDEWGYWGNYPFAWIEPKRLYASWMPGASD